MNAHFYHLKSDGQVFRCCFQDCMCEITRHPSGEPAFSGPTRRGQAWIWRLLRANKSGDFEYKQLHASGVNGVADTTPKPNNPPFDRAAEIDPETGAVQQPPLPIEADDTALYLIVVRTSGVPSPSVRNTLRGQQFHWNPDDARGDKTYPLGVWLRHRTPGNLLQHYRKLIVDLGRQSKTALEFDYQKQP